MLSEKCQNTTRDIRLDDKRYNQNLFYSAIPENRGFFGGLQKIFASNFRSVF